MSFDTTNAVVAHTVYSATKVVEIAARQKLRVTAPAGTDLLDETVPAGKKWTVTVRVEVHEVDA